LGEKSLKRIFALILACFSLNSLAEEVSGLYSGLVPVIDQSAESQQLGVREALNQVLVKLTGNSRIMQSPNIQPFLTDQNAFVAGVGFRSLPQVDTSFEPEIGLEVSFSRQGIDQLIRQAQLPVLPSNRPKLLVWIVRDDAIEGRGFIDEYTASQASPSALELFDQAMSARGMPYRLPAFDLEDQLSLSVNEAWSLRADLIEAASERYKTDGWIALRFYTTSSGGVRGAWLYKASGRRQLNDFRASYGEPFMAAAVDGLVDSLAESFTYVPQINTNELIVNIDGVTTFKDYQAVLAQFKKLELVDSLDVHGVEGEQLTLAVDVEGGAELLHSALVRSGKLQSQIEQEALYTGQLQFTWIHK
jgi:hypothetical protein